MLDRVVELRAELSDHFARREAGKVDIVDPLVAIVAASRSGCNAGDAF